MEALHGELGGLPVEVLDVAGPGAWRVARPPLTERMSALALHATARAAGPPPYPLLMPVSLSLVMRTVRTSPNSAPISRSFSSVVS